MATTIFSGFDTSVYPGDATMTKWRGASPYSFAGYYLKAPCHSHSGWMGKRAALAAMGWKLLPVYVGQQVAGVSPCTSSVLTAVQGRADAADAGAKLKADGFAPGTFVYLDIERCDVFPAAMHDYVAAFVAAIASEGFSPGLYCHKHNAPDIRTAALASAPNPRFWIAGGVAAAFKIETSKPADSGIEFADVWQSPVSVTRTFAGAPILIDENVSAHADPAV